MIDPTLWRRHYPPSVPHEIDPDQVGTLTRLYAEAIREHGPRAAYTSRDTTLTYDELDRHVAAFAAYLQGELGVRKGDRVALVLPNLLAYPIALFATLRIGAVAVNTNPLYTAREMRDQLADAGAAVAVVFESMAATLAEARTGLPDLRHVLIARVGDAMGTRGVAVDFAVRRVKRLVPAYDIPDAHLVRTALATWAGRTPDPVDLTPDDVAFLQYTGGTTGRAKGAMLTHRNVVANATQCHEWFRPILGRRGQDVVITALPLYHVFALTVNCILMLRVGAHNVLILNPRDLRAFVGELRRRPFSVLTGVNTLFGHLMSAPDVGRVDFSRLTLALAGGMATQRPVSDRWRDLTGLPLVEGYGLTEASPVTTCNRLDQQEFTGAIGYPLPSTELAVRDRDGHDLDVGEVGELCFRGPQVMAGYWNQPEETAAVMHPDGFLATGDLGRIGADGLVKVLERAKDTIVVSGFNVYPNEVEEVAVGCPGVREAACVGLPDERSGEIVALFLVADDEDLSVDTVMAHLGRNLTRYKVPHRVEFRDELPKTPVGKVLRRALREEAIRA